MKRKLDQNDEPTVEVDEQDGDTQSAEPSFRSFNLDSRLLQALAKCEFSEPTPVQSKAIPLALAGKDILAKSRTGSGKTAAYAVPAIQSILARKATNPKEKAVSVLVLVPTRDLSDQVTRVFANLAEFSSKDVRALNLTQRLSDAVLSAKLQLLPDIVVSTPGRASQLLANGLLNLESIRLLVIDEADLVLSYGYEDDMNTISQKLSTAVQTFLVSATLTPDVEQLKTLFCRDPAIVKIDEKEDEGDGVTQYVVKCGEEDKFLLVFVIFKLKLVKGRCIIFVADVDRSYRLKLYLEQYGIKSCVLNSELPVNSRLHVVEEFNKSMYDILIAADDQEVLGGVHRKSKKSTEGDEAELTEEDDDNENDNDAEPDKKQKLEKKRISKDFGVSRGIDFQNVSCVVNFDLPKSSKSYTHRIGRTARARKSGMALSFVIPRSEYNKHKPTSHPSCRSDEKVLEKIIARQAKKGNEVKPYQFDMDQVSAFRYRMNDALRAVTRVAVHEARAREIKHELIRSERLRKHFEDNPEDLRHLQRRSDGGALGGGGVVRVQSHLKHVPEYLMPEKGKTSTATEDVGFVSINGDNPKHDRHKNKKRKGSSSSTFKKGGRGKLNARAKGRAAGGGGKNDPLKTFRTNKR